ncbi:MAG: hypothetical protein D6806_18300, partial [Deltaproteobacteria bacterium]
MDRRTEIQPFQIELVSGQTSFTGAAVGTGVFSLLVEFEPGQAPQNGKQFDAVVLRIPDQHVELGKCRY